MPATIKDIARQLNISVSTVSYALNNGPKPVSIAVRARVLEAAKELDYQPNRIARSLVTRRTHAIGVIPPRLHRDMMLSPFIQKVMNGIVNAAEATRQDVVLLTAFDRSTDATMEGGLGSRIDGLIVISPKTNGLLLEHLRRREIPHVTVAGGPAHSDHCFGIDNREGVRLALEHLVALGHRRIAHVTGPLDLEDAYIRFQAYREFMIEHDLFRPEYAVIGEFRPQEGYMSTQKLLSLATPPTAIFAANDDSAIGCCEAILENGLSVPEDISVVGFDDLPLGWRHNPTLTTIRQPTEEMGEAAFYAILGKIEGQDILGKQFPTALVLRTSTTCPKEDIY